MSSSQSLSPTTLVGISISAAPDLRARGMGEIHVRHAFIEIVRHILSAGASIAYGGDLRRSGYTYAMFDLVRTYKMSERLGPERVRNYLAWPIFDGLSTSERAAAKQIATLVRVEAPEGAPTILPSAESGDPTDRAWAAKALTGMRAMMAKEVTAQVVLGGKTSGQTGVVPGIAEEAALAIRARNPLYAIGGFGGCATLVADVFREGKSSRLTLDYQLEAGTGDFQRMVKAMGHDWPASGFVK